MIAGYIKCTLCTRTIYIFLISKTIMNYNRYESNFLNDHIFTCKGNGRYQLYVKSTDYIFYFISINEAMIYWIKKNRELATIEMYTYETIII